MRIITSATYRHLQQQAETANKVPGLETELENTKDKLTTYTRQHEDDTARIQDLEKELEAATRQADTEIGELRQQLVAAHKAIANVVTALTTTPNRDAAFQETARVISKNAGALGLWPNQHKAVDALVPRVAVLLSYGRIHSVHRSKDAAKAAAGCGDIDWDDMTRPSGKRLREMWQAVVTLPVNGPWTDRTWVGLVLDGEGVPLSAHGYGNGYSTGATPQLFDSTHRFEIFPVKEPVAATA